MNLLMVPDGSLEDIAPRWRVVTPAKALEARGHKVSYYKPDKHWPDLVVVSRPAWAEAGALVRGWRQRGIPVIADLDDWFFHGAVPETVSGTWAGVESCGWPESMHASFTEASAITVATKEFLPTLQQYQIDTMYGGSEKPVKVLRNYYDDTDLQWGVAPGLQFDRVTLPGRKEDTVDMAFIGSATHAGDLLWIKDALAEVLKAYKNVRLFVTEGNQKHLRGLPRIRALPYVDWREYSQLLGRFDIILAPLEPHPLNACKSWIRLLEANLAGVPYVCSCTGPYLEYMLETIYPTGFLAEDRKSWLKDEGEFPVGKDPDEVKDRWYWAMAHAIAQPGTRAAYAVTGRERTVGRFAMSKHIEEREQFYQAVIDREKQL